MIDDVTRVTSLGKMINCRRKHQQIHAPVFILPSIRKHKLAPNSQRLLSTSATANPTRAPYSSTPLPALSRSFLPLKLHHQFIPNTRCLNAPNKGPRLPHSTLEGGAWSGYLAHAAQPVLAFRAQGRDRENVHGHANWAFALSLKAPTLLGKSDDIVRLLMLAKGFL